MDLSIKRTREGAPVLYISNNANTCLMDYVGKGYPVTKDFDYCLSLSGNTDVWMSVRSSMFDIEFPSFASIGVSYACSKYPETIGLVRDLTESVVLDDDNLELAIDFYKGVLESRGVSRSVARFARDCFSASDEPFVSLVAKNFSDLGYYYSIPILRDTFLAALSDATSTINTKRSNVKAFADNIAKFVSVQSIDDLDDLSTALGMSKSMFEVILPNFINSVGRCFNKSEEKYFASVVFTRFLLLFVPTSDYYDVADMCTSALKSHRLHDKYASVLDVEEVFA